jgi:sodium-dependent dicarboxylate transporter 2/3/5
MSPLQKLGLILGIAGFLLPFVIHFDGLSFPGHLALSIFLMAAFFWMSEPIPIHATSLLVILLGVGLLSGAGPVFGGMDPELVFGMHGFRPGSAAAYVGTLANPIIILFLGGFMLADAAVKFDFDRNVTRVLMKPFGTRPKWILLGLMTVTGLLSAFMSNTATTAMMMTVILPFMATMPSGDRFKVALALGIPFAANIGGMATPIGSPPNAIVVAASARAGHPISFGEWMSMALPLVIIAMLATWWLLYRLHRPTVSEIRLRQDTEWNRSTKARLFYGVFAITLVCWVTESWHGISSNYVALVPITFLSVFSVMEPADLRKLPWEVLWLVAGGIALGIYMEQTKLSDWMVGLIDWSVFSGIVILAVFALIGLVISNFMSNTVAATLLMPVAITIGMTQGDASVANPTLLALMIGLGTSFAMVLPISTPPNAIAMATGVVKTSDMAKSGLGVGLIGILLLITFSLLFWNDIVH